MRHLILLSGLLTLAACVPATDRSAFATPIAVDEGVVDVVPGAGPPDAAPGACYERVDIPAMGVQPTDPGPAPLPRLVAAPRERWLPVPCEMVRGDRDFIASLQRALAVRGLDPGPATGVMTRRTEGAIRAYQAPQGLDSTTLSLASARQLGLSLWNPDMASRPGG